MLALRRVEDVLGQAGIRYDVVWSPGFRPGALHLAGVRPEEYSYLVFVCGPLHGPQVEDLHRRFAHCVRIAVGTSVVDPGTPAATGFHRVLARDAPGTEPVHDLSARASGTSVPPVAGVILTHGRHEYGTSPRPTGAGSSPTHGASHTRMSSTPGSNRAAGAPRGPHNKVTDSARAATARTASSTSPKLSKRATRAFTSPSPLEATGSGGTGPVPRPRPHAGRPLSCPGGFPAAVSHRVDRPLDHGHQDHGLRLGPAEGPPMARMPERRRPAGDRCAPTDTGLSDTRVTRPGRIRTPCSAGCIPYDRPVVNFLLERTAPLPRDEAWRRLTHWARHGDAVPLTRITVTTPEPTHEGTLVVARSGIGPLSFDDPMEVTVWRPPTDDLPGLCRLDKRGRFITGWAELEVHPGPGGRTRVLWREELRVRLLPRLFDPLLTATARYVFGRAVNGLLRRP